MLTFERRGLDDKYTVALIALAAGSLIEALEIGSMTHKLYIVSPKKMIIKSLLLICTNPVTDALKDIWIDFSNVLNDNILDDFGQDITTSINVSGATATVNANAVPEPASILLIGTGLAGILARRTRKY